MWFFDKRCILSVTDLVHLLLFSEQNDSKHTVDFNHVRDSLCIKSSIYIPHVLQIQVTAAFKPEEQTLYLSPVTRCEVSGKLRTELDSGNVNSERIDTKKCIN